ncbi:hypothetical protein AB8S26_26180, partial [Klebsiella pneumoniae]
RNAGQPCRPVARLCITLPSDRRVQKNLTTTNSYIPATSTYSGYQAYQPVTAPAGRSYIDQSKSEYHISVDGGGNGTQLDRQLQDALEKFERDKRARQRASMNHD